MTTGKREVAVVGGGIVGILSALQLLQRGWDVTLMDRLIPGDVLQTSWGNAGSVSIGNVMPLGKPGLVMDGLKMLLSRDAPLTMPLSNLHRSLPWVLGVAKYSSERTSMQIAREIGGLNMLSRQVWGELIEQWKLQPFLSANGWLKLYEKEVSYKKTAKERQLMEELGIPFDVLGTEEIREHDPSLSSGFAKAIYQKNSLGIDTPGRLMAHLWEQAQGLGLKFVGGEVTHIGRTEQGFMVQSSGSVHRFEKLLITSGAWSSVLAEGLSHSFPLQAERGYHLFFEQPIPLKGPTINMDRYVAMSPMKGGLRVTSCVELGGLKRPPNYTRMRRLSRFARAALPALKNEAVSEWMGYRPSLPDSKPVIGQSDKVPGLYFAFGNGHLGMTQGPATARLVAEVINNDTPSLDMKAFSPARFG